MRSTTKKAKAATAAPAAPTAKNAAAVSDVESGPLVRSSYHSEKHVIPGEGRRIWEAEKATT